MNSDVDKTADDDLLLLVLGVVPAVCHHIRLMADHRHRVHTSGVDFEVNRWQR